MEMQMTIDEDRSVAAEPPGLFAPQMLLGKGQYRMETARGSMTIMIQTLREDQDLMSSARPAVEASGDDI